MTIYFAYGSNMDRAQMARRCPDSTFLDAAALEGWRFLINQRGVATIAPHPDEVVHGTLWRLGGEDEATLDRYEGVHLGNYDRLDVTVTTSTSTRHRALVYVDWRDAHGPPRHGYLDGILRGADHAGLPGAYRRFLAEWADEPVGWSRLSRSRPAT